eukprot:2038912-Ditylum_brightwellii.AAC.1
MIRSGNRPRRQQMKHSAVDAGHTAALTGSILCSLPLCLIPQSNTGTGMQNNGDLFAAADFVHQAFFPERYGVGLVANQAWAAEAPVTFVVVLPQRDILWRFEKWPCYCLPYPCHPEDDSKSFWHVHHRERG